jgi:hypothetical protein
MDNPGEPSLYQKILRLAGTPLIGGMSDFRVASHPLVAAVLVTIPILSWNRCARAANSWLTGAWTAAA